MSDTPEHITLHFDLPTHAIPLDNFVDCVTGTQEILNNLNKQFFNTSDDIKVSILPAEPGGYIINLIIGVTLVGGGFIFHTLCGSAVTGLFKAAFGGTPEELILQYFDAESKAEILHDHKISQKQKALILMKCTRYFLENNSKTLAGLEITENEFREALEGKNKFFNACLRNKSLKAVGFDGTYNFSVSKNNFSAHIASLSPVEEIESDIMYYETFDLEIYSASSKKNNTAGWGAVLAGSSNIGDIKDQNISFKMLDNNFWNSLDKGNINFSPNLRDKATIQCAFVKSKNKIINVKALNVISYNDVCISKELDEIELKKLCNPISIIKRVKSTQGSLDLFN